MYASHLALVEFTFGDLNVYYMHVLSLSVIDGHIQGSRGMHVKVDGRDRGDRSNSEMTIQGDQESSYMY